MNMEVKIWSDVRCPFCYIGKHNFEKALEQFEHKDKIKVTWKSFELDPTIKTRTGLSELDYLAKVKGMGKAQVEQMFEHIKTSAKDTGIEFNFEDAVVANSFNAHRVMQFAKTKGKGNDIEEAMFKAHFTDGLNIDDNEELVQIAASVGLDKKEVEEVVNSDQFADKVTEDIATAQQIGVRGVPFFVLNDKYAVSGAQPTDSFLQALQQSYKEFAEENKPDLIVTEGQSCDIDGNCD